MRTRNSFSPSRRRVLQSAAWLALGATLPMACSRTAPRVVIVGAGLAGLAAANVLRAGGIEAAVYDAAERAGGRVLTVRDAIAPGSISEFGAEFVAAEHTELIALARELKVELSEISPEAARPSFFFGGTHYTPDQLADALRPLYERVVADAKAAGTAHYRAVTDVARKFDSLPVPAYLDQLGASGWLRDLLELACVSEFGLDAEAQSALNLMQRFSRNDVHALATTLGGGDRRYRISDGADRLVHGLLVRVRGQVEYQRKLVRLRRTADDYLLTLDRGNEAATEVRADVVILAVPFATLRDVELDLPLPDEKRNAISNLGYGSHTTLAAGFEQPVWRVRGFSGTLLTDAPLQACREFPVRGGAGLTFQPGGRPGVELGHDSPAQQVNRLAVGLERAFPGARDARTDAIVRYHWSSLEHSKGSRACYKPGQWVQYAGVEAEPVERLFFAGEHTASQFRGTMNGAIESGRRAAEAVISLVAG